LPNRIITHLKKLDALRDRTDEQVDKTMEIIADNIDLLLQNPKKFMKSISIEYLKKEKHIFSEARKEGKLLRESI